jgi:hypothetical protein
MALRSDSLRAIGNRFQPTLDEVLFGAAEPPWCETSNTMRAHRQALLGRLRKESERFGAEPGDLWAYLLSEAEKYNYAEHGQSDLMQLVSDIQAARLVEDKVRAEAERKREEAAK